MAIQDLQDEILIKDQDGSFKLLKGGQLESPPSDDLIVPDDDLLVVQEDQLKGKPVADFYFDVSDENELRAFKNKTNEKQRRIFDAYVDYKAGEIISQAGLAKLAGRNGQLKNIIKSYLRGVRSPALTKEALSSLKGTAGLAEDWRRVLLNLLAKEKRIMEETAKSGKLPMIRRKPEEEKSAVGQKNPRAKPAPLAEWGIEYKKQHQVVPGNELPKAIVMGPVDELKSLTLADFRKMADSPEGAAEKILEKISYLEDESLIKRAEGIKAWKQSEIYKLYLQIGNLSLAQKKPVERVIFELRETGQPYLTPTEFQAVADLNNRLSY